VPWEVESEFIARLESSKKNPAGSGSKCLATLAHGRKSDIRNSTFELRKNSRAYWTKLTSLLRS
jgi:hypothetical protein